MGTATLGVQTIMIGAQSLACNPVYGIIAMAVGAACVAFATAEAQESLGYGNWLKDTVGMSDEVYNGVMVAVNVAAIAINIVGVKQCFKEGTLVACLNENGEEVRKPIETVVVGTLVLAYDEATGEKAYKPVVQLFKNETKRWCTVTVEVDGQEEQIVSTSGHKYYLPNNTESREIGLQQEHESYITLSEKWVSACKLKTGDKVLLSDGKYGIIVSVKVEELETHEATYNFEVEDFHTYFVGENPVCVHNKNCNIQTGDAEDYSVHESKRAAYRAAKRDAGVLSQQPIKPNGQAVAHAVDRNGHVLRQGATYNFKGGKQILLHSGGHPEYGMTRHFNYNGWHYFY